MKSRIAALTLLALLPTPLFAAETTPDPANNKFAFTASDGDALFGIERVQDSQGFNFYSCGASNGSCELINAKPLTRQELKSSRSALLKDMTKKSLNDPSVNNKDENFKLRAAYHGLLVADPVLMDSMLAQGSHQSADPQVIKSLVENAQLVAKLSGKAANTPAREEQEKLRKCHATLALANQSNQGIYAETRPFTTLDAAFSDLTRDMDAFNEAIGSKELTEDFIKKSGMDEDELKLFAEQAQKASSEPEKLSLKACMRLLTLAQTMTEEVARRVIQATDAGKELPHRFVIDALDSAEIVKNAQEELGVTSGAAAK